MSEVTQSIDRDGAIRLTVEVWHPGCWVLETSRQTAVGLLSYGCFSREDGTTTSAFTLYADELSTIDEAVDVLTDAPAVYTVAEMVRDYRNGVQKPGNATREFLIDHDGTTQIYDEFAKRGFFPSAPVDTRSNTEVWTLLTHHPRDQIYSLIEEIETEKDASISVTSITQTPEVWENTPLPVDQLSSRQREVFRLAQARGYYDHPRQTNADELADELDVTSSTVHEHLRKAEAKLLSE
jgi:predicted DNA binding protein